ncbi:MAG TPA: ATP-binding protein [Oligoflexus sp.]|uniref:ATP-binding protein n=1 Tax=Oligoflexus sp. TaxID=1971216 RepID=UPI002D2AE638|nr:ATP-binding protein [Oligoflexus sp.]HYX38211.1 ATP-binding protein [Oligoflexus sp.]
MNVWKLLVFFLLGNILVPQLVVAKEYPRLIKGVLDVRGWDFEKDGPIPLEGEAEFYWDRFMDPNPSNWDGSIKPVYIDVNGGWQKAGFSVYGKGTYRIRIEGDRAAKLAIADMWAWTSVRHFVNGSLLSATEQTVDGQLVSPFPAARTLSEAPSLDYDMIFHIENQDFFLGGIASIYEVGSPETVSKNYMKKSILNAGIFFAFITLAIYNLGLFAVNRREWGPLLLASLCLSICGLLAGGPGIAGVVFSSVDRFLYLKVYNLAFFCAIPIIWLYMKVMFPDFCPTGVVKFMVALSVPTLVVTLFSAPRIYLEISMYIQILGLFSFFSVLVMATRAAFKKQLGALVFLLGSTVSIVFSVIQMLINKGLLPSFPAAAIGMLFFSFSQSFILSMRFAEMLRKVRRSEVEIRTLNEDLREKEKARTLFFHNTSHELRTPLNGIIGFVDLIEQGRYGELTDATRGQLVKVKNLAVSLKLQVNTILDLAKSKQGKLDLKNTQFPLRILVRDSQNLAEGLNLKKPQVQFALDTQGLDAASLWIHDYEKVFTIIRNLIGNAFKFTAVDKASQVGLLLKLEPDQTLRIVVSDTGIGIPANHIDKIFQEFQQVDSDARRSYEGTGLGLAMVRDLVSLMKGTIEVKSQEGLGSTFSVKIPAQTVIHAEQSEITVDWAKSQSPRIAPSPGLSDVARTDASKQEPAHRHLVLVVDDNEMNCEVVRDILLMEGYEVMLAFGGRDALLKLRGHHPDLVLLDLMMPEVSGEDVLQAMRADPELDNIPVILLTARATEEDRIHGLELGADDYLAKPLIARELLLRVHNLLVRIESTRLLEGVEHREKMALMGELLSDLSHELKNIHHADAYSSKSLVEHVEALLQLFPSLQTSGLNAEILLAEASDITATNSREQMLLSMLPGKPDRYDRRLAMYLSALPVDYDSVVPIWKCCQALPLEQRRAFESLLAMLQHVSALSQSSERTQELITAVLDYGRYHKGDSAVDINRVITSSLTFLQARFRRAGIKVENQLAAYNVQASSSDLQQIALNILNNAYDAVKGLAPDQERLVVISGVEDHEHKTVRLRFVNKGPVIPSDVLPHIFERRFTTKGEKGSGLGLYVSRRLAVKNHGDLQAVSGDGVTAFELTLRKAG